MSNSQQMQEGRGLRRLSKTVADHNIEAALFKRTGAVLACHDAKDASIVSLLSASFLSPKARRQLQAGWGL